MEKFVERGTDYSLEFGKLSIYETNCACRDIKFYFEQNVITVMMSGHKTVVSENLQLEFFPGTLFIPEREIVQVVTIPNASFDNPTKCLVLEVDPAFLNRYYEEIFYSEKDQAILDSKRPNEPQQHFLSNDQKIVENFIRLYKHHTQEHSRANEMIGTIILKELLLRIFQTKGLYLLMNNFEYKIEYSDIQKSILYIKSNLQNKISVEQLAGVSGLGLTTFFKRFKAATSLSPVEFILQERIKQAKILIKKGQIELKEIAYNCGFNSYEYFCSSFKKAEKLSPNLYKAKS